MVDDLQVRIEILLLNHNGMKWFYAIVCMAGKDALQPMKAVERHGVFARFIDGLAAEATDHKTISIDTTSRLSWLFWNNARLSGVFGKVWCKG